MPISLSSSSSDISPLANEGSLPYLANPCSLCSQLFCSHRPNSDPSDNTHVDLSVHRRCPALSSPSAWSESILYLASPESDSLPSIPKDDLNQNFKFLACHRSMPELLGSIPTPDQTLFLVHPLNLRHLLMSYGHFSRENMFDILRCLNVHVSRSSNKDRLYRRLFQCQASEANFLFVFKSTPRSRRLRPIQIASSGGRSNARRMISTQSLESLAARRARQAVFAVSARARAAELRSVLRASALEETRNSFPQICPDDLRASIVRDFQRYIHPERWKITPCAVCQISCYGENFDLVPFDDINFSVLQNPDIPDDLMPSSYDTVLYGNAILYAPGMHSTHSKGPLTLCSTCSKCLKSSPPTLPEFALANGYYYGYEALPPPVMDAFSRASPFDLMLVARCRAARITHRFTSGVHFRGNPATAQSYSRGHTIILPQDPSGIRSVLPPPPDEVNAAMCALFVGKTKPSLENISKLSPVLVSKSIVRTLIEFLLDKNPFYQASSVLSEDNFSALFADDDPSSDQGIPQAIELGFLELDQSVRSSTSDYTDRYDELDSLPSSEVLMEAVGYTEGDHSPQNYREMKARALSWCRRGHTFLKSKSGSKPLSDSDPSFLTSVFPHLDPWGIGGFTNPQRSNRSSFLRQVQHLLRIHDSPFEKDPNFAYICWNIITRAEVNKSMSFRVKDRQRSNVVKDILSFSPDTLDSLAKKWEQNPNAKASSADERLAMSTLRKLRQVSCNLRGSAGHKQEMRNEIRGMMNLKGTPALFVTLNPSDVHHPLVRVLAGDNAPLNKLTRGVTLDKFQRAVLVAERPAVAAKFFDTMVSGFIECVLRPEKGPGLFGSCSGYYGTVEAQGKGTLHLHLLIWLEGNLNPQALRDKMSSDPAFTQQMFSWLEDTICTSVPAPPGSVPTAGPPTKPSRPPDTLHPSSIYPPQLADCADQDEFAQKFRAFVSDLVHECNWHSHSDTCWKHLKPGERQIDENCRMRIDGTTRALTEIDEETGSILLRRLHPWINNFNELIIFLMQCNMDIKYIGSGEAAKALTYYITDYITKAPLPMHAGLAALSYAIRRNADKFGGQPIEPEIHDKSLLIKSVNAMMARLEISHQQVMSYLVGGGDHYTSHSFRNLRWGDLDRHVRALENIEESEDEMERQSVDTDSEAPVQEGGYDASNSLAGREEDVGQEDLDETEGDSDELADVEPSSKEPDVVLHLGYRSITASSQLYDYRFRPKEQSFESLSIWEVVSGTEKITIASDGEDQPIETPGTTVKRGRKPLPRGAFSSADHPQFDTHRLRLRATKLVPVLLGPTIARATKGPESYETWCRAMLILFKPWRILPDLKEPGQTWSEAFASYDFPESLRCVMRNINVQHECEDARDRFNDLRRAGKIHDSLLPQLGVQQELVDANEDLEGDLADDDDLDSEAESVDGDIDREDDTQLDLAGHEADAGSALRIAMALMAPTKGSADLMDCTGLQAFEEMSLEDRATIKSHTRYMEDLKRDAKPTTKSDGTRPMAEASTGIRFDEDADVTMEQIGEHIVIHHDVVISSGGVDQDSPLDAIEKIVDECGLRGNEEQERAFRLVAEHFVSGNTEQMLMYLGGLGGTGKSYVIRAIVELFRRCGCPESVLLSAPTGIAAVLIEGYTIHSLTLLPKGKRSKDVNKLEHIWRGVRWLILDEISMVSASLLSQISHQISLAKGSVPSSHDKPFGGVNVLFAGDFGQLRPVHATVLFDHKLLRRVLINTAQTPYGQTNLHGAFLWRQVTQHVQLKKNWRQFHDAKYSNLVARVHDGRAWQAIRPHTAEQRGNGENYGSSDYQVLLSRTIQNLSRTHRALDKFHDAPFIVATRDVRDPLNLLRLKQFAAETGQSIDIFVSKDFCGKRRVNITEQERLRRISSTTCKDAMGQLPLVAGMKVMITENIAIAQGAVNGALGTLVSIKYEVDGEGNKIAACAYVHIPGSGLKIDGLADDIVPIVPQKTTFPYRAPSGKTFNISRWQLPLIPAYAFTDYKSQGGTFVSAVVDLAGCKSLQSAYVMLSRVKTLEGLAVLRWFKPNKLTQHLQQDWRDEFERLRVLHEDTKMRFDRRKPLTQNDVDLGLFESYIARRNRGY